MAEQHKDKLDELLDSMLSEYSSAEPGPGLETRVLAGVREAERGKTYRWWSWKWLWVGATTAVVLLLILSLGRRRPSEPVQVQGRPQPVEQPVQPAVENTKPPRAEQAGSHQPKPLVRPLVRSAALALNRRPAVFPTPAPLSEQEQLLLRYVAHTPREELIAQSHPDEPSPVAAAEDQSNLAVPEMIFIPQKFSNTR